MHLNPRLDWSVEVGIRTPDGQSVKVRVDSGGECAVYGRVTEPEAAGTDEPGWASAQLSEEDLAAILALGSAAVGEFELRCGRPASDQQCTISVTVESGGLSIWRRRSFATIQLGSESREGAIVKMLCELAPRLLGQRVPKIFRQP